MQGSIPKHTIITVKIPVIMECNKFGFVAYSNCPELKGLIADGKTEDEVLDNFKDASICYMKSLLKHNDPLPIGSTIYVRKITAKKPLIKDIEIPLNLDECLAAV